jgi:hypothetical protein
MGNDHIPKKPIGHTPGGQFVDTGDPHGMKIGIITRVDEVSMKADVRVMTGAGDRFEIDLTQAMCGPRSFWGGVPEVNSLVIIGYRRRHKQLYEAMILGFIPTGQRMGYRFDPYSPVDPTQVAAGDQTDVQQIFGSGYRVKRIKMRPGDVGGMSAGGAEFVLTKDIRAFNRSGDLFELRDTDRTWVGQSIHRVENESGVTRISGPIRRGAFYTYPDILQSAGQTNVTGVASAPGAAASTTSTAAQTLQTAANRYFGTPAYQASGPGFSGGSNKFADANGVLLDVFNNTTEFPPVTYSNGRQVYYTCTYPAVNLEDPENGGGAMAFVEYRTEVEHQSDMTQEVIEEIDGFAVGSRRTYIEHVFGTTVGNDPNSSAGQRVYNRPTKPKIFDDFTDVGAGVFAMDEVPRSPLDDQEMYTTAGAFLMAIHPPRSISDDYFACSVSKQGKVFLNVPGSTFERYPDGTKNVSVEARLLGALKAYIGAATPDNTSINLTCQGGITANIGSNSDGRAIDVTYHSSVQATYVGTPDTDNVALTEDVQGVKQTYCSGDSIENVKGSKVLTTNGGYQVNADRVSIASNNGMSISAQDMSCTFAGKSQYQYALVVQENIATGGKISTILAGALVTTAVAGAISTTAAAGAVSTTAGGAWAVQAGGAASLTAGGAASLTAAGAISATAGAAVAVTAALALTLTASTAASLIGIQVLLGGPAAVLGIARGLPMMPPGTPSLDWITGLPLQGCATSRSI